MVTPFLPGDSLLFVVGALSATGALDLQSVILLLMAAAFLGDNTNYWIGRFIGPRVFTQESRWLNRRHLEKTEAFYAKHGGKVFYPDLEFCTDNGAMIAFAGGLRFAQQQGSKDYRFDVKPRWNLAEIHTAT